MSTRILQLKITLKGSKPPIWRRILVKEDITFYKLHKIIQEAMGWLNYHLYEFSVEGQQIGQPDPDFDREVKTAQRVKLVSWNFREKDKFTYTYDFGDNWEHTVVVEKILAPQEGQVYPFCLAGKRSAPPEDVGGIWGYENFLEALADPEHPEHEELIEWAGEDFDPESFSLVEINQLLRRIK